MNEDERNAASRAPRVLVIADDLTGANDSGAQIAKAGFQTLTLFDAREIGRRPADAIVIDTETRTLPVEAARLRLRETARAVKSLSEAVLYKKIDSTLRGPIGAELDELVRELDPELVVCLAAYPTNGRTTRGGIHCVHGTPLDESEFARDPTNPIESALLSEVLGRGTARRVHHIALEELRSGRWLSFMTGGGLFTFDCERDEDIEEVVGKLGAGRRSTLWCGSAGLAEVLMRSLEGAVGGVGRSELQTPGDGRDQAPVLSVVGSASAVSREQVAEACRRGAFVLRLDIERLRRSPEAEARRLASELEGSKAPHLILTVGPTGGEAGLGREGGQAPSVGSGGLPGRVVACLSEAARLFLARRDVAGLFLTGGETAYSVASALGVRGMWIRGELEPGIPAVEFAGGRLDGLRAVTKAGAFGRARTLESAYRYLRPESETRPSARAGR